MREAVGGGRGAVMVPCEAGVDEGFDAGLVDGKLQRGVKCQE